MIPSATRVLHRLAQQYTAKGMVDFGTPEDTLLTTLLSARTRDEQVLKVYPGLRRAFPTLNDLASASVADIARAISSIGLYRNKAKAIHALAGILVEKYHGQVPRTMEELIELPGVGRKTASCVLSYAFKLPAIAVDIHVFRITHRLGWVHGKDPVEVEQELKQGIPRKEWIQVNRVLVQFGQDICRPGKPVCWRCPVAKWCAYQPKTPPPRA